MSTAEEEIGRQLQDGERLLWCGVPRQGVRLRASDVFIVPFSVLWCGFAIAWETTVVSIGGYALLMAAFGLPFVLIGLHFVFGRFLVDSKMRARTCYGLTDRRVVLVSGLRSRNVTSIALADLGAVGLREFADESGTVSFGESMRISRFALPIPVAGMWWPTPPAFEMIERARDVYAQVLKARDASSG